MVALLLTADLGCSSKSSGAAARAGVELNVAMSAAALLEKAAARPADVVMLDLTMPGVALADLVAQLKALPVPAGAVIAFGPHVHEGKLAAAAAAGCDLVVTRGQFHAQLEQLLGRYRRKDDA